MKKTILAVCTLCAGMMMLNSCGNNNPVTNPDVDEIPEELVELLDKIPSEELSLQDITLENGNNIVDFLEEYDPEFVEKNPWILGLKNLDKTNKSESQEVKAYKANNVTGNAGIANLRNAVIAKFISGFEFFLNDPQGVATHDDVKKKIAEPDNQQGLWYKWNGKIWDEYSYGDTKPLNGERKKCYGLDCSGLVYAGMNHIGYNVSIKNANDYYNVSVWQNSLKSFLAQFKNFPDAIKDNLKFEKYEYSNQEFPSKIRPGDIFFCLNKNGVATHTGLVQGSYKLAQSNGSEHPNTAEENYFTKSGYQRGPRLISPQEMATGKGWNYYKFGVIRLVSTLNNTHWRLKIKCEGHSTYITQFDIEIKMQESTKGEITIEPVNTIGYDYDGEQCDVHFEGTFNMETQVLKGSVRKTYPSSTRTDGFEVKLTDDSMYDIQEYRIISNDACVNYLDLENIDNENIKSSSSRKNVKLNTSSFRLKSNDCSDSKVFVF